MEGEKKIRNKKNNPMGMREYVGREGEKKIWGGKKKN
jgi:hypothetical protein